MTPLLVDKLEMMSHQFENAEKEMASGKGNWQELGTLHSRLSPVIKVYRQWQQATKDLEDLKAMIDDPEMSDWARLEIELLQKTKQGAEKNIQHLLSPVCAENSRNCFIEIRAAVGGNESCLFAADLLRMYLRAADAIGWKTEIISQSDGEVGGYKEVILFISGESCYGRLKFESGAHRVQRVPETESQGRVHTSIVTVAVLAEYDKEDDLVIVPADLRIETFRASGAGGQHVNTTDSAVRITHLPTGIASECQDERSQHRNKDKAMSVLKARIVDALKKERLQKKASERKSLVGSGDRSDRIRTYNFPQGRVTDHRIGITLYKLALFMEGDIEDILNALAKADEEEQIIES